ncbi:hypothetical protein BLOT_013911 [Blomia tropicalis]|nr:hypothetical protein BLOT_013911 [Blomia tropicalis]
MTYQFLRIIKIKRRILTHIIWFKLKMFINFSSILNDSCDVRLLQHNNNNDVVDQSIMMDRSFNRKRVDWNPF